MSEGALWSWRNWRALDEINTTVMAAGRINAITFCNKKNGQITAVLVTYPNRGNYSKKGQNAQNTGLEANSFHCHIVGRGRKIR